MQAQALKYLAIAAVTLFSVSSCSVDEDYSDLEKSTQTTSKERTVENQSAGNSSDKIIFKVKSENNARSSYSSAENVLRQFRITAYEGGINFFNGRTDIVTTNDNGVSWTSDYNRYWPSNRPSDWSGLTFYAFTEGNSRNRSADDNGSVNLDVSKAIPMIKDYVVKSNPDNQADLLYAVAKDVNKSVSNGEVNLNFKHALCKVYFTASNDDSRFSNIEILSVEFGGVKGLGSYQFPDLSQNKSQTIYISDSAPTGKWTIPSNAEDQTYVLPDINVNLASSAQTSTRLNDGMFLIPQQMEARKDKSSNSGSYFKIMIRTTSKDKTEPNAPEVLYYPTSINWKEGRSYCYDISWTNPLTVISLIESPL